MPGCNRRCASGGLFEPVADLNARAVIADCVEDQHPAIRGFRANPPFMEKIDGITFDVVPVKRVDCDERYLGVGLLFDLAA